MNPFRTIRARLLAFTLLAFGAVVVALAFVAVDVSERAVRSSIDADLKRRGLGFARVVGGGESPGRGRGGPPPGGPPGDGPPGRSSPDLTRRNNDWTAPAHLVVGQSGRGGVDSAMYDPEGYGEALRGKEAFTTIDVGDEPRRVYSVPVLKGGRVTDVVQVAYPMSPALESLNVLRRTLMLTVVPFGLTLGGLASFLLVGRLLRPLRRMDAEARRIGAGGFGERLVPQGHDEFASLAGTLNGMIEGLEGVYRREHEANARLQEGIERQRRFTGDASHELKTPLAVLKTYLGVLKRSRRTVAEEGEAIGAMERAADRMNGLIGDLLLLARSDSGIVGERAPCRLDGILADAIGSVPGDPHRVDLRASDDLWVHASCGELTRLFVNLVENALQHSGAESPVEVAAFPEGREIVVSVTDRGGGIAPEHLPHLFERFYRAEASRASATGGNGLGLAICERIVADHGGGIDVESRLGEGTRFTVRLPRLERDS